MRGVRTESNGRPRIIEIWADSAESADLGVDAAHWAAELAQCSVEIHRLVPAAFQSSHVVGAPDPKACAAVAMLTKRGLMHDGFRRGILGLVRRTWIRDDLRVFVVLTGITPAEFDTRAAGEDDVCREIKETIQVNGDLSLESIGEHLAEYLRGLRQIQDEARWRSLRIHSLSLAGQAAVACQLLAVFVVVIGLVLGVIPDGMATLARHLPGVEKIAPQMVSLSVGATVLWANTFLLFFALRGFRTAGFSTKRQPWVMQSLCATFALLSVITLGTQRFMREDWQFLGQALGLCADSLRRTSRNAKRLKWHLSPENLAVTPATQEYPGLPTSKNIDGLPFWPVHEVSTAISYARASEWSSQLAQELSHALASEGVKVFIDSALPTGANWWRELQRAIATSTIFVSVIDTHAAGRGWVAAEFSAVMAGRRLGGLPEIITLEHPELSLVEAAPVFRKCLGQLPDRALSRAPRRIVVSKRTVEVLSRSLSREATSLSVIPRAWFRLIGALFLPLTVSGSLAPISLAVCGLWALEMWKGAQVLHSLSSRVIAGVALVLAFWAGFGARMVVVMRFRVRHGLTWKFLFLQLAMISGCVGLLAVWNEELSGLVLGWAVFATCAGWWQAGVLVEIGLQAEERSPK